ncbi:right-handed parallel beta-helix repeat-containing protein [Actinokineospora sp. HUAS TT18]|uniref:right-handed parallel beta-helix repeat-containing protein n=1 Tax=Actinokineospora sp. HUAS TT18 TaxID=3447451 RepID=UPI003F51DDBD
MTLYAAPSGSGGVCSSAAPCSLGGAQAAVRAKLAEIPDADVKVLLRDGTYTLSSTWKFGAADSGTPGHPVVWQAAPGARPVISGATTVTGWTQVGTTGVYSAPVPAGSQTRQVYVNGKTAKIAQDTSVALGWTASWTGSSSGYTISGDAKATAWFGALTPAQVAAVEFSYPGKNGPWAHSSCRVESYTAATGLLKMTQPCWENTTKRAPFAQATGGLPSMSTNTKPTDVRNAYSLLSEGEWFLDSAASKLFYKPAAGEQMSTLDVKLPRLESLLQGAGTLSNPLHDVTFTGLQFSYATWNRPSNAAGFADIQSNLTMTLPGGNQGWCTFSDPDGVCPFGALSQPKANVEFTASNNVSLTQNKFAALGGAGLSVMYGSKNTLIQGNEFADIASTGILLGCTYDPTPTDPTHHAGIKQNCTPDAAAVAGDTIGENEILTGTTISDNIVHEIGKEYTSACGITLLFSRDTTITNNNLYDLPYTGITGGVIQGHVDDASHPQNSTNINADNKITNNVIHNYLSVRHDGGAVYLEGHQAKYHYKADGTIDPVATLAHGMLVTGNVAYNSPQSNFSYYDDAGAEWIKWKGNVAFNGGESSQGGCSPTGHIWTEDNYFSHRTQYYPCAQPVDTHVSGTVSIPAAPGPDHIPAAMLSGGVRDQYNPYLAMLTPKAYYKSAPTAANKVLIAGQGFTAATQVWVNNQQVSAGNVQRLSSGFLTATVPAGTTADRISVTARVDNTSPAIAYSGFSLSSNRGFGDYNNDIQYATANGSTATYSFTGTGIDVYGEKYSDQGDIGISVDGGAQEIVSTTDSTRRANVVVFSKRNLAAGPHTIVVTKLSGQYATLDGFLPILAEPVQYRIDNTNSAITYSGFAPQGNRGFGDLNDDVHFASANGSTATYTFTGTGIKVFGEKYTDQGNLGVTIDGGTQQVVSTVPADGVRQANVVVFSKTGLSAGSHTIVVTKLSGSWATLDGFEFID